MNKIALITGSSSGFGKACSIKFAQNGYKLIITGRRKEKLEELKSDLEQAYGTQVMILSFDIRIKEHVFSAISSLSDEWKNIDVLINNAGLALGRDYFDKADLNDWESMIDTNIKGLLYMSKAVLPLMIERQNGHIINIGSTAGKEVYEKGNIYCATKHAVEAISKAMRIDLLQHRIKVTVINPGAAETEFSKVRFKGDEESALKVYEGFQPLKAEDVAETVFYCAGLPKHVCINELEMTSLSQANSFYTYKELVM
jgi:NADP-dependent 3-hydroxy acid dehydrogenase YdfG